MQAEVFKLLHEQDIFWSCKSITALNVYTVDMYIFIENMAQYSTFIKKMQSYVRLEI